MAAAHSCRVFVSYSHADRSICDQVVAVLRTAGVLPRTDVDFKHGPTAFDRQLQTDISHAHVFVPILTPRSHERGWVHQEIGYALAMKVPCVPICVGSLPDGMLAMSQAVVVDEDLAGLEDKLAGVDFQGLVEQASQLWIPPAEAAIEPEERAITIARYCDEARRVAGLGCVRISGGLSSFSLPDQPPHHPMWQARYGNKPRLPYSYQVFRRERNAVAQHAMAAGLRMIINGGLNVDRDYGEGVTRTRLCILTQFLEMFEGSDENVQLVVVDEHPAHLTLSVGDWFFAESLAGRPVRGVLHTVFTTHAPSVSRHNTEFDRNLLGVLKDQRTAPAESRAVALDRLRSRIRELPPHPAWTCSAETPR
jgi:hypothetical protein